MHNRLFYLYYIHKGQPPFINCIIRPPEGEGKALLRKKFSIIGGDMRNVYLADLLKKDYQYVEIYGFERSGKPWALKDTPLDFVLEGSRVVVGGIPLLKDNGFLNMPLSKEKLCFSELLEKSQRRSSYCREDKRCGKETAGAEKGEMYRPAGSGGDGSAKCCSHC